jgi:DNA-binding transcriptional MerR regulator
MRTLKTSEAAAFLNVSPNTLRSWERRFGFPRPRRSPGQHRLYTYGDVTALRDALLAGLSISSAISVAQEGLRSGMNPLLGALAAFDGAGADDVMESTLALRSIEATVEEVLLPALDQIADRQGSDSAPMAFAARWANDWLRRAARIAYAPGDRARIVIGDASRDEFDLDGVRIRALELLCVRSGPAPLCLPVRGLGAIGHAVSAHRPAALVIAGRHGTDDEVARWAYGVRSAAGALPVALYARRRDSERLHTSSSRQLSDAPSAAQREIAEMVAAPAAEPAETSTALPSERQRVRMRRAV